MNAKVKKVRTVWSPEYQKRVMILERLQARVYVDRPRVMCVTVFWADRSIPAKSFYGQSVADCEAFVDFWRREVASDMTVEYQGTEGQGALERILA